MNEPNETDACDLAPKPPGRSKTTIGCGLLLVAIVLAPCFEVVQVQVFTVGAGVGERGPVRDMFIRNLWNRGDLGRRALAGLFRSGDLKLREDIARRFSWDHPSEQRSVVPAGFEPLLPELLELYKTAKSDDVVPRLAQIVKFAEPRAFADAGMERLNRDAFPMDVLVVIDLVKLPDVGCAEVIRQLDEVKHRIDRENVVKELISELQNHRQNDPLVQTRRALSEEWPGWPPELRALFAKACEELGAKPAPLDVLIPSETRPSGESTGESE